MKVKVEDMWKYPLGKVVVDEENDKILVYLGKEEFDGSMKFWNSTVEMTEYYEDVSDEVEMVSGLPLDIDTVVKAGLNELMILIGEGWDLTSKNMNLNNEFDRLHALLKVRELVKHNISDDKV